MVGRVVQEGAEVRQPVQGETSVAIKVDGLGYRTIADVRAEFGGVAERTIRNWIRAGIVPEPRQVRWGTRWVMVCTPEWVEEAKRALDNLGNDSSSKQTP
jgi:hypothetical protein